MTRRGLTAGLIALGIVWAAAGCSQAARTPSWASGLATPAGGDSSGHGIAPGIAATRTAEIDPFTSGSLADGWTLDRSQLDETTPLDCTVDEPAASAVGAGTLQCGSTADAADACWVSPESTGEIWCLDTFDVESRVLRVLAARGADADNPAPDDPTPAFLELSDGSRWWLRSGGAWGSRADGGNPVYGCGNDEGACAQRDDPSGALFILSYPYQEVLDRSEPMWTVQVGQTGSPEDEFPDPEQVDVTQAWFLAGGP